MTTLTTTDAWRTCTESARTAHCSTVVIVSHFTFHGSSSERILTSIHGHPHGALSLTRFSTFYFFLFFLSVPVFFFHLELSSELHYTIVMANLRCSAAEESEATLNAFTAPQVLSPSSLPSTTSTTRQFPSPSRSRPRTRTWMT